MTYHEAQFTHPTEVELINLARRFGATEEELQNIYFEYLYDREPQLAFANLAEKATDYQTELTRDDVKQLVAMSSGLNMSLGSLWTIEEYEDWLFQLYGKLFRAMTNANETIGDA